MPLMRRIPIFRLFAAVLMLWVVALALTVQAEAGPAARPQGAPPTKFATEVPLLDCDGTPCVEAHIGSGPTLKMAIDTGNIHSILETDLAKGAGLQPVGAIPAGAPAGMFRTAIPAITVGTVKLENVSALAMVLGDMIAQNQLPHIDGTLAYTAFKDRILELDFAVRKLRISEVLKASAVCPGTCDKISLIKFGKDGPPIVVADGFAINGHPVTAQVDSMYTGTLLVYTASIQKLQLEEAAKTTKSRDFPFTDGGVQMKEAVASGETFHGLALGPRIPLVYFPTPDVHEPDGLFDATVGLDLFYGAILTLNFHDMAISVRKG
jgi:hypothetical protein